MSKKDRNGRRKARSTGARFDGPDLGYYLIVTDTKETEQNYMNGLRDSIPENLKRRLIIKVRNTETNNLVNETLSKAALHLQYVEPWIVFDRDQVPKFDEIIQLAQNSGIRVAWSNPCIEIWFSAYFNAMPNYQSSVECCSGFDETYRKRTGHKYKKSDEQIYNKLCKYGDETVAIQLAESKVKAQIKDKKLKPSEMCPATTTYGLVSEIKKKINN